MPTVWGVVHGGAIEVSEGLELPEGCKVLVTLFSDADDAFWKAASEKSLEAIWDNPQDDAYAQLLEK